MLSVQVRFWLAAGLLFTTGGMATALDPCNVPLTLSPSERAELLRVGDRAMTMAEIRTLANAGEPTFADLGPPGDRSFERFEAAVWQLVCSGGTADRKVLRHLISGSDPKRSFVAYGLAVLGDKDGLDLLVRISEAKTGGCSRAMDHAGYLLTLGDPRGVRLFFEAFDRDDRPQICLSAAKITARELPSVAAKLDDFDFVGSSLELLKRDPKIFGQLVAELLARGTAIAKWRTTSCESLRTLLPKGELGRPFVAKEVARYCSVAREKREALWHWLPALSESAKILPTKPKAATRSNACKNRFALSTAAVRSIWLVVDGREMTNAEIRKLVAAGIPKLGSLQDLPDSDMAEAEARERYFYAVWNVACADEPGDRDLLWKVARSAADDTMVIYPLAAMGESEAGEIFARLAKEEKGGCTKDFANAAYLMALEDARGVRLWFDAFDRDDHPERCLRLAEVSAKELPDQAAKIDPFDYVATLVSLQQRDPAIYGDLVAQLLARGAPFEKWQAGVCAALGEVQAVAPRNQLLVAEAKQKYCAGPAAVGNPDAN